MLNSGLRIPPSAGSASGVLPNPVGYNRLYVWVDKKDFSYEAWWEAFKMGRVDLTTKAGQVELWEVANPTDMDHPFHLHGTQFQVIERERKGSRTKAPYLAWKDTVNIATAETVRFKVREDMKGLRMYHCHILEHEDQGMMGVLDVI